LTPHGPSTTISLGANPGPWRGDGSIAALAERCCRFRDPGGLEPQGGSAPRNLQRFKPCNLHQVIATVGNPMMVTTSDVIKEIVNPIRHNDLKARRLKLGLNRVALGRILGVDRATVFRHEQGVLSPLWDYALRGIEAEAKTGKLPLRSFKSGLDHQAFMPEQLAARGHSYIAEKMHEARKEHARTRHRPSPPRRADDVLVAKKIGGHRVLTQSEIKAAADRAEARSKKRGG
jgi:DNA-binding XRE family transcriptional regulator